MDPSDFRDGGKYDTSSCYDMNNDGDDVRCGIGDAMPRRSCTADPYQCDRQGRTALHAAAFAASLSCVEALLDIVDDTDDDDIAASAGRVDQDQQMDASRRINEGSSELAMAVDDDDRNALFYCVGKADRPKERLALCKYLIRRGCASSASHDDDDDDDDDDYGGGDDDDGGNSSEGDEGDDQAMKDIVVDSFGRTPLHYGESVTFAGRNQCRQLERCFDICRIH